MPPGDDMTEAETAVAEHAGIENHPHGLILVRLVRLVKVARVKLAQLEARIAALENKP